MVSKDNVLNPLTLTQCGRAILPGPLRAHSMRPNPLPADWSQRERGQSGRFEP